MLLWRRAGKGDGSRNFICGCGLHQLQFLLSICHPLKNKKPSSSSKKITGSWGPHPEQVLVLAPLLVRTKDSDHATSRLSKPPGPCAHGSPSSCHKPYFSVLQLTLSSFSPLPFVPSLLFLLLCFLPSHLPGRAPRFWFIILGTSSQKPLK